MSARCLGEQVSGRRTDHDKVRRARQLDMAHLCFVIEAEEVAIAFIAGKRGNRQRGDELRPAFGQDASAGNAALCQRTDQFQRLVGGDAAADNEKDTLAAHDRVSGCPASP